MFQMLGVFAEFERALIRERMMAGLKRARAQGKTLGRPKVDEATEVAILRSLKKGVGIKKTARDAWLRNRYGDQSQKRGPRVGV
jgi:DNA invertase Pin-like site-specific DNA recombinase